MVKTFDQTYSRLMRSIFWFRRDLRLHDNTALYHALSAELRVVPIFIFDTEILKQLEDKADSRVTFIHKSLQQLENELQKLGSHLQVFYGKPQEVLKKLLRSKEYSKLFLNHDYEPYAI